MLNEAVLAILLHPHPPPCHGGSLPFATSTLHSLLKTKIKIFLDPSLKPLPSRFHLIFLLLQQNSSPKKGLHYLPFSKFPSEFLNTIFLPQHSREITLVKVTSNLQVVKSNGYFPSHLIWPNSILDHTSLPWNTVFTWHPGHHIFGFSFHLTSNAFGLLLILLISPTCKHWM